MSDIQPNTPVSFVDCRGVAFWGTAQSPVITENQPWPVVMVKVAYREKLVRVPARDVTVARVSGTVALEKVA